MSRPSSEAPTFKLNRSSATRHPDPQPEISDEVELDGTPVPLAVRIRARLRTVRLTLPALVAALGYLVAGGFEAAAPAVAVMLLIMALTRLVSDFPYPLRLIPATRVALALLPVLAAIGVAALFGFGAGGALGSSSLLGALAAGSLCALAIEVVEGKVLSARPLRIAVIGGADFVPAIRRELDAIGGRRDVEVLGWLNLGAGSATRRGSVDVETLARVRAAVTKHDIDLLVRGPGTGAAGAGREAYDTIAAGCLDLPVRMIDGNQLYEQVFGHVPIGTIDSAWFLFLMHPSFRPSSKHWKRAFDLVIGCLAGVLALPAVALGVLAIKLSDRGPVLYRQRRVGEQGDEFEILKLRTMSVGAQVGEPRWAAAADERVTPVGRILRRLHIDELPQIVNVLRGEMTLVGPRPEQPEITAALEQAFPHYTRRLLVKPGVTGWAQVRCGYAGSELGAAWKLCHDLYYLKHRSLLADALILLETLVIAARDSHREMRAPQAEFLVRLESEPPAGENVLRDPREVPLDAFPKHAAPATSVIG